MTDLVTKSNACHDLLSCVVMCFEKGELTWCWWILRKLFSANETTLEGDGTNGSSSDNTNNQPIANLFLNYLEDVLERISATPELWIEVWELYTMQAINFMQPRRITSISKRCLPHSFLGECGLAVLVSTFSAYQLLSQNEDGTVKLQ